MSLVLKIYQFMIAKIYDLLSNHALTKQRQAIGALCHKVITLQDKVDSQEKLLQASEELIKELDQKLISLGVVYE
jgi:hypothetical protein